MTGQSFLALEPGISFPEIFHLAHTKRNSGMSNF
jgi:hypothetical protein